MKALLKYSLLASFIVIATKLIVFFTHSQFTTFGIYSGLISLLFISIPLFLAIKKVRDNELGGFITLREIMKTGMGVSVISGLIISVFIFLYYKFIDHETMEQLIVKSENIMRKANKSKPEIDVAIISLKEFYSPFKQATGVLTGVLTAGVILSFLSSAVLVKNPEQKTN